MAQVRAIVDQLLTDASAAYIPVGFICEEAVPMIPSKQSSGKLAKYGTNHLRVENSRKAGRGQYRRVEPIARSSSVFLIEGHGLEGLVTPDDYRNVIEPYDAEKDEVMGLTNLLLVEKESSMASAFTSTSIVTQNTTLSGDGQLNNFATSDPLGAFKAARAAVKAGCGMAANVAIVPYLVANALRFHPALMDVLGFKFNRAGGLSDEELAKALFVDEVYVPAAAYESAKEGQSSSLSEIWSKDILFAVLPKKAQKYQVSFSYFIGLEGKSSRQVYKYPENNPPESTGILVEDNYDFLIANANAGYLIKNAIA